MATISYRPGQPRPGKNRSDVLDKIAAAALNDSEKRLQGYREQSLRIYPWVCARCSREFTRENLQELTVHHKDHNHDNNPPDGSNWENLCIYCHDQEHSKYLEHAARGNKPIVREPENLATHNPFESLKAMLANKGEKK